MTDRSGSLPDVEYRYGFNGKESDNEVKGEANQQDYGFRVYDPRVGRFLSLDPLAEKYISWSPYNYCLNNPINHTDPSGDTVRLYSQTIPSTYNMQRHLYLRITTNGYDKVVEVWGPDKDKVARGTAVPKVYDFKDLDKRPGIEEHEIIRPNDAPEGNEQFENQILELAAFFGENKQVTEDGKLKTNFVNLPSYGYYEDNSNGYVNALVKMAGGKLSDVPFNATGVGRTKTYENAVHGSSCGALCFPLYNEGKKLNPMDYIILAR